MALRDLGECRLKDIDRPERVFQLELEGMSSDFPPLKTLDPETQFAGREDELEAATRAAIVRRYTLWRRVFSLAALAGAIAVAVSVYTLSGDSEPAA